MKYKLIATVIEMVQIFFLIKDYLQTWNGEKIEKNNLELNTLITYVKKNSNQNGKILITIWIISSLGNFGRIVTAIFYSV